MSESEASGSAEACVFQHIRLSFRRRLASTLVQYSYFILHFGPVWTWKEEIAPKGCWRIAHAKEPTFDKTPLIFWGSQSKWGRSGKCGITEIKCKSARWHRYSNSRKVTGTERPPPYGWLLDIFVDPQEKKQQCWVNTCLIVWLYML